MSTRNAKKTERKRAEVIMKVRAGLMSATEAAAELKTSRKTYYKWERRALEGMMEGLCERSPGRPPGDPDAETEALRQQVRKLEKQLEEQKKAEELRRDLNELVRKERVRQTREHEHSMRRIRWEKPRLVWAMDDTEYRPDHRYPKAFMHNVQDLGSRYKFAPLVGLRLAGGLTVAGRLSELFADHGPPLFLKRDNGGNLNHREVDKLLSAALVIPVNSPCYYPQYNGSIEHAQGEIKERLAGHGAAPNAFLSIQAEVDVQELNHKPRRDLNYRTPCAVFASGRSLARTYTRRKRREVYDTIYEIMLELISKEGYQAHSAWRLAVEKWLLDNGFITVSGGGKV